MVGRIFVRRLAVGGLALAVASMIGFSQPVRGLGAAQLTSASTNEPFTTLASGFTQDLYASGTPGIGDVAFASNGDPLVVSSAMFDVNASTTTTQDGSTIHPYTTYSSAAPLFFGVVNGQNGGIYANTCSGIYEIDSAGNILAGPYGPAGNGLGITVDPKTGNLVYPDQNGNFAWVNESLSSTGVFALTAFNGTGGCGETAPADGLIFDPTGDYLFAAVGQVAEYDRSGNLVQSIPSSSGPDGMAFHSGSPQFLVSNNNDGTITRYDFPGGNLSSAPTESVLASGGFRGDLSQVGNDGCFYVTQNGTRFADGTTSSAGSLVQICAGFIPPVAIATTLVANPFVASVLPGLKVFLTPSATLTEGSGGPVSGEVVTFSAGGTAICSATTNSAGYAACSGTLPGLLPVLQSEGYVAKFAGDGALQPSQAKGNILTVDGTKV
ncbi:MAG: YncE family protein [Acidimicrobiales bacterium]